MSTTDRFRRRGICTLCSCVVFVVAGCSSPPAPSANPSQAGTTTATAAPGSSALKRIDPAAFQASVAAAAKVMLVPGTVVVLRTPQGNFTAAAGTTQLGVDTPPTADTHFRIASNTKTMTAALIVQLAQDGKLRFSDSVSNYVPDVPNGKNITIAELLTMRSGLYGYTSASEFAATLDSDPTKVWAPQEVLAIAFGRPPVFPPGTSFDYSNTNYVLLGLIAEKVGGQPLAQQFQDRLFGPLGLRQTSLPAANDTSIPDPYSHGYMYGGSFYALVDTEYPADMQAAATAGTLQPIDYTNQNSSYATAAGGAISTADDLATWMQSTGRGRRPQRRLPATLARQPADRGSRQSRWPEIRVRHPVSAFRAERLDVLPPGRNAGVQFVHGIRHRQRRDTRHLDEPDRVPRRQSHGECLVTNGPGRDLRGAVGGAHCGSDHD